MSKRLENAVQSKDWFHRLPRPAYRQWEKLDLGLPWFEVYRLPCDIYAIYEPGHFQEVISFLIKGRRDSLLFDSGLGIGNIRNIVLKLIDHEPLVINSHFHFDHIGDNHRFSRVAIYNEAFAVHRLRKGYTHEELQCHLTEDSVCIDYPPDFDPQNYHIPPTEPRLLEAGEIFDLGDRSLELIHTPGHTADSIMLWDKKNRSLFTGDTIYPATLYAHFNDKYSGYSDVRIYGETMEKLTALIPDLHYLFCSHNIPLVKPSVLADVALAFKRVLQDQMPYQIDQHNLRRYAFKDFSIVTQNV